MLQNFTSGGLTFQSERCLVHDNDGPDDLDATAQIPSLPLYMFANSNNFDDLTRARGVDEDAPVVVFVLRLTYLLHPRTLVLLECTPNAGVAIGTIVSANLYKCESNCYVDATMSMMLWQKGFEHVGIWRCRYKYLNLWQFLIEEFFVLPPEKLRAHRRRDAEDAVARLLRTADQASAA